MRQFALTISVLFLTAAGSLAQQRTDRCHVYVVDTALAKKASEADEDAGAAQSDQDPRRVQA